MKKRVMKMNLQFFAEPGSSDMEALDGLLDGTTTTITEPAPPVDPPVETPPVTEPAPPAQNRQEYAFAEMRKTNAALMGVVEKIAKVSGIEYQSHEDLLSKLNDDTLSKLATQTNVPVEMYKRLDELEQFRAQQYEEQLKTSAMLGFQGVKTTYGLTDAELQQFAVELDERDRNPFVQEVDLMSEYLILHQNDIINKRVEAAVQAALQKSNVADTHSTTPGTLAGTGNTEPAKVSTLASLNSFLDGKQ